MSLVVWWCNKHIHQEFGNLHIDHSRFCVCLKYCVWAWLHRSFCSNYPLRQVQQSGGYFNNISHQNNLQGGVLVPNCEHHGTSSVILLYLKNKVQSSKFFSGWQVHSFGCAFDLSLCLVSYDYWANTWMTCFLTYLLLNLLKAMWRLVGMIVAKLCWHKW